MVWRNSIFRTQTKRPELRPFGLLLNLTHRRPKPRARGRQCVSSQNHQSEPPVRTTGMPLPRLTRRHPTKPRSTGPNNESHHAHHARDGHTSPHCHHNSKQESSHDDSIIQPMRPNHQHASCYAATIAVHPAITDTPGTTSATGTAAATGASHGAALVANAQPLLDA